MDDHRFSDPLQETDANSESKVKQIWNHLTPKRKKIAVFTAVGIAFLLFCWVSYSSRNTGVVENGQTKDGDKKVKAIKMDDNLIEKSLYRTTTGIIEKQQAELASMRAEIADLKSGKLQRTPQAVPVPDKGDASEKSVNADAKIEDAETRIVQKQSKDVQLPPPPKVEAVRDRLFNAVPPAPTNSAAMSHTQLLGGIEMVEQAVEAPKTDQDRVKKKEDSIYLPPSFMEATTLSGMAAPTTNAGKNNPLPMLLRIKTPAFLPNKVKANLKGCYVIGEGVGDLASERIHIRLKTLSCVAQDGAAVIDQGIHGFVTDGDGRVGLRGKVVAKMGMHVARTALAGFIEGVGEGLSTSTTTQSITGLGTASEVFNDTNLDTIATSGAGKGIANAAESLKNFYLQLSEQTLPVIEVGSQKNVTVVIAEGTALEIKQKTIKS